MSTRLYHLGSPERGASCSSRRTGYVKKYAVSAERFDAVPEIERCKRCNALHKALRAASEKYAPALRRLADS